MEQNIEDLGKGLIGEHPKDQDPKRFQLLGIHEMVGAATNVFDESFGLPIPPNENQGSSLSCTWQAFSYYFWVWTGVQLSRQDGYSRTHLPGGGGYLIDPFKMLMENAEGCYSRQQHADPSKQTEQNMIIKVSLPGQVRKTYKVRFWYVDGGYNNIAATAQAAKMWKGAVIGVNGNNADWKDKTHPKVPKPGTIEWSHALYVNDAGHDRNQECVICKSSWCSSTHNKHFIIKDYFTSGNVFSPIVMEVKDITNNMDETLIINFKGAYGFLRVSDGRVLAGALTANQDELKALEKVFEKTVIKPDGSFEKADITYGI